MEKIEKLELGRVIKSDRFWSAGMIIEKINEIIDCLNQDQLEEEGWYCECGEKVEKGEHICEEELEGFIQQEIDRAREEGRQEIIQLLKDKKQLEEFNLTKQK